MKTVSKVLATLLTITMLSGCAVSAQAAVSCVAQEEVNVYKDAALTKYWGTIKSGTKVRVNGTMGGVSQIQLKGKKGYCEADVLSDTTQKQEEVLTSTVTTQKTRVYRSANIRSAYSVVSAGTKVEVLAVSGSCARVRKGKSIGYVYVGHLEAYAGSTDVTDDEKYQEAIDKVDDTGITSLSDMISSGRYSNEQIIFAFAIKCLGYNAGAACGLLANISYESGFKTEIGGDSGTSYGLCQWHASRKTRLMTYCSNNGYDYKSLEGQLWYLKYELETFYPSVHKFMKAADDSADGAYDAGYYFCYNFEGPANRISQSKARAEAAQTRFYTKYAGYVI